MSYSNISGLDLFGDPFSNNNYSKTTQPKTTTTQQKTPVQQPAKSNSTATQSEPIKTQAKTPVLQQNPSTPVPEPAPNPKPVTSTSTKEPAPADTKPQPEQPKKELVMDMSGSDTVSKTPVTYDVAKRKAHEESEAKRKAQWEAKQLAKKQAETEAIQRLNDMSDDDVTAAAIKRIGTDVERITKRNMKECVAKHIQELARKDVVFARKTMHPRKSMINCFKYINHRAKEFIEQEMKDNDIKPENGVYGSDVPDGLCYKWAEDYFNDIDVPEDGEKEEKFVPKPYVGTTSKTSSKTKKVASKAKKAEKPATNEAKKNQESKDNYQQMSLF